MGAETLLIPSPYKNLPKARTLRSRDTVNESDVWNPQLDEARKPRGPKLVTCRVGPKTMDAGGRGCFEGRGEEQTLPTLGVVRHPIPHHSGPRLIRGE